MAVRPIDANALRKRVAERIQKLNDSGMSATDVFTWYALKGVLDYIDTAPTIEVKDDG